MKKIIYSLLSVLFIAITLNSCVDDTDYDTPQINCEEPTLTGTEIQMSSIIQNWEALNFGTADENNLSFDYDSTDYITGYVVSSDRTGNFYKEIFIQDAPENPTTSLKLSIGVSRLYTKYNVGRKVYVYLKGLTLGKVHGELILGKLVNNEIDGMNENDAKENILRNCSSVDITPIAISKPSDVNYSHLGKFVTINNVQFVDDLLGQNYVDPNDMYDSHRALISCEDGSILKLETSTYADFDLTSLPVGSGSISGIISRDYRDDFFVIRINTPEDVVFNDSRCGSIELTPTMTMAEFMDNYSGEIFPSENIIFEAYVISNDAAGNFYKNIYVQDAIENPTVGLQILVDEHSLYQSYPVGSKVYIKPGGLYKGVSHGVVSLGYFDGTYPSRIESGQIESFVVNSGDVATITPVEAHLESVGHLFQNKLDNDGNPILNDPTDPDSGYVQEPVPASVLVNIENMQLHISELGSAYAYYNGNLSVNKTLISCDTDNTIILRNSGYSNFANLEFPSLRGNITAVYSAYNSTKQLYIRDTDDINFDGDRCDPVFYEDFNGYDEYSTDFSGWTNVNVNGGSHLFQIRTYSGAKYVQLSAHNSGENPLETWLVTPVINLDSSSDEILTFTTKTGYYNGDALSVLISTDFTGDVTTATWTDLSDEATLATGPAYGWGSLTPSGDIDLSSYSGDIYIAFKYLGADGGITTTFQIDDILVDGN